MFSITETVKYSQLDKDGALSIPALLNIYQDCATLHSCAAGYELDWFIENRRGWFVTSYQARVYRYPRHSEVLKINTYPVAIKGFLGYRLFEVVDEKGEVISEAYSEWVHMNLEKGRPIRIIEGMDKAYGIDDRPTDMWGSRKIELPMEKGEEIGRFVVDGIYVDTNGHMNNAFYPQAALSFMDEGSFGKIKLEFKKSATRGSEIIIRRFNISSQIFISMESPEGDSYCLIEFEK